jgi:hypothetical protein
MGKIVVEVTLTILAIGSWAVVVFAMPSSPHPPIHAEAMASCTGSQVTASHDIEVRARYEQEGPLRPVAAGTPCRR